MQYILKGKYHVIAEVLMGHVFALCFTGRRHKGFTFKVPLKIKVTTTTSKTGIVV